MNMEEIIDTLMNARCNDPCECIFGLYDYDDKYNGICKATNPPMNIWENLGGCPFCEKLAGMIKDNSCDKCY